MVSLTTQQVFLGTLVNATFDNTQLSNNTNNEFHLFNLNDYNILQEPLTRIIIITIHIIFIFLGFISNSTVIFIAIKTFHKNKQTSLIFVIALASSDLCLCLCVPIQLHYQLTLQWKFGSLLCKLIHISYALPMFLSTSCVCFIAIDRFCLVLHPFKAHISLRTSVCSLISIGLFSVLMATPVIHNSRIERVSILNFTNVYCVEEWETTHLRYLYSCVTFCFLCALPLIITCFLYAKILLRLKNRTTQSAKIFEKKNIKTFKIIFFIVLNFTLCWTPWNIFSLVFELHPTLLAAHHMSLLDLSFKGLILLSVCTNPVLYCWLNERLRQDLREVKIKLTEVRLKNISMKSKTTINNDKWRNSKQNNYQLPKVVIDHASSAATHSCNKQLTSSSSPKQTSPLNRSVNSAKIATLSNSFV